jgi:hypothetical protein
MGNCYDQKESGDGFGMTKDVIIPLGLLSLIVLAGFAMVHAGRKQRQMKRKAFKDFADGKGLRYLEEDDGTAREYARDFDGVGRFRSASLGEVIPQDVVTGRLHGMQAVSFRHSIRYGEGWAREWFAAGLTASAPIAERCSVQFCKRRSDKSTMHLHEPVVKARKIGPFDVVVRAASASCAGTMADDRVLEKLAKAAEALSLRPEIQIRKNRLIVYPADRNAEIDDARSLDELFEFAAKVADIGVQATKERPASRA